MDFVNLPIENLDVKTKTINQKKIDIDLKYFLKNDIIIISSGTATGKTKDVAKKSKKFYCIILVVKFCQL
jgi:predicted HNH restriction endonuclease